MCAPDDGRMGPRPGRERRDMPSVEERLAYLEGRVHEHGTTLGEMSSAIAGVRSEISTLAADLRGEMRALRTELRGEMDAMRTELRGEISGVRGEISGVRGEISGVRGEIGDLRKEMTVNFRWLIGMLAVAATALAIDFFR